MKKNVGGIDRVIRIVLGIVLAAAGLFASMGGGLRAVVLLAAGIMLFTGFYGF